jgi:hypothetical protein
MVPTGNGLHGSCGCLGHPHVLLIVDFLLDQNGGLGVLDP